MKISKRQLKRIIREEKAKIVAEGISYQIQEDLDSLGYKVGEEINGLMGQHDRRWYENPEIMNAIQTMLNDVKSQFSSFTTNNP